MERGFLALGVVALGICAVCWAEARMWQSLQNHRLERALRKGSARPRARPGGRLHGGSWGSSLVGRIELPRLGLSAMIGEGIDGFTLLHAVGHVPGTALPGQPGNVAVSGHRDSFFRSLRNVRVNDLVKIVTPSGSFFYRVDSTDIVTPDRTDVLGDGGEPTL